MSDLTNNRTTLAPSCRHCTLAKTHYEVEEQYRYWCFDCGSYFCPFHSKNGVTFSPSFYPVGYCYAFCCCDCMTTMLNNRFNENIQEPQLLNLQKLD